MQDRLKQIRKELNFTQPEMGEKTGKGRDTIANYELGRAKPDETFLMLLNEKYGYSLDWIRTGKGDKKIQTPHWEAGAAFAAKAMKQSVEEARKWLTEFFDGWPDEEVLLCYELLKKHFPNQNDSSEE